MESKAARSRSHKRKPAVRKRVAAGTGVEAEAPAAGLEAATEAAGIESPSEAAEAEDSFSETSRAAASDAPGISTVEAEPESKPPRVSSYSKRKALEQAEETATWLLLIINGAAVMAFGEDARMTAAEQKMILEPLSRMMARVDPAVNDALQKWTDPILILFGIATWGLRLYAIQKDREDDNGPGPKTPPKVVIPPSNGNGVRESAPTGEAPEEIWQHTGPPLELIQQVGDSSEAIG